MLRKEQRELNPVQSSQNFSGPFRYLPLTAGVAAPLALICPFLLYSHPDRLMAAFAIANIKLDSQLVRVCSNRLHAIREPLARTTTHSRLNVCINRTHINANCHSCNIAINFWVLCAASINLQKTHEGAQTREERLSTLSSATLKVPSTASHFRSIISFLAAIGASLSLPSSAEGGQDSPLECHLLINHCKLIKSTLGLITGQIHALICMMLMVVMVLKE